MKTKKRAHAPSGFTRGVKVTAKKSARRHARKPRSESLVGMDILDKPYLDSIN